MPSHALSTRHWGLHSGAQEKGTPSFESSIFHLHDEKSEHEHGHTSTSEDDLLKLLNLPDCTQNWTRFDKGAKTYRSTSSSGLLWKKVVARITIDDETGHIMSLEYTKHTTEKDLHRNLPSVRDIRTVLLHFLIVAVFLWLVKQDWCEAILEQMWGSTSLGRGGVFSELKEEFRSGRSPGCQWG